MSPGSRLDLNQSRQNVAFRRCSPIAACQDVILGWGAAVHRLDGVPKLQSVAFWQPVRGRPGGEL